jgi:hypothetical protein
VPEEFFRVKPLKNYQERYRGKLIYPPAFEEVSKAKANAMSKDTADMTRNQPKVE